MTADHIKPPVTNRPNWWAVLAAVAFFTSPVLMWMGLRALENSRLEPCEDAIMAELIAPTTYERIDVSSMGDRYHITYDAQNAFGVPIRKSGYCVIEGGSATWAPSVLR